MEERLINFSVSIINIIDTIPKTKAANHLSGQLIRSGTSAALNYGEAQSAESAKDFIHKMRIILKELRETLICLKIIQKGKLIPTNKEINLIENENNELIAIFVKSIETAQKNIKS